MIGLCSCRCSWCLKGCVCTGGLVHTNSDPWLPPLPKDKLGPDVSGCHPSVCPVRAHEGTEMCHHQDREHWEPWHSWGPALPRAFHVQSLEGCVYNRPSSSSSWASSQFAEGQAHAAHCKQQYHRILSHLWLLPAPAVQFIMFFHCTITMTCDSISAVGSAWHTPSISTAPSGSLPPLSLLHLTPPTSRLARKWKICFQLTSASTHKFSPFHSLLITVIPKWPPNELSISCKSCFHTSCIVDVSAYKTCV